MRNEIGTKVQLTTAPDNKIRMEVTIAAQIRRSYVVRDVERAEVLRKQILDRVEPAFEQDDVFISDEILFHGWM